jgi:hypothetical protein
MEAHYKDEDDSYFRNSSIKRDSEIDVKFSNLLINDHSKSYLPFSTHNRYSKSDFEVIELLGKGAYAKVVKAIYLKTKEIKAIKIIDKSFIERVRIS